MPEVSSERVRNPVRTQKRTAPEKAKKVLKILKKKIIKTFFVVETVGIEPMTS